uniref:Reverse transcriptase domain-containing protein n=1 Tax=Chenopodium quinoa TaxID=63459 RepID=A0A803KVF9_CHEQI
MKVDLNKAYDKVSWVFIEGVIRKINFPERWVRWIMECITSVSYPLLINGEPTKWFNPSVGLRQGDPLSPYIFILCMEVLSRRVSFLQGSGILTGIKPEHTTKIPTYPKEAAKRVKQEKTLGTYLGCPMDIDGRSTSALNFLVERVHQKVLSWKFQCLSQAGKLVLIHSILIAILSHIMYVYLLPKKFVTKMTSFCLQFFWGKSMGKKPIYWRKREVLEMRKEEGGLGFRNVSMLNKALIFKQAWRIHKEGKSLVSRVLKGKYHHSPIELAKRNKMPSKVSWEFRSMIKVAQQMKEGVGKCISNGRSTSITEDVWLKCGRVALKQSIGEEERSEYTKVSHLINAAGNWNCSLVWRLFPFHTARTILCNPTLPLPDEDKDIWIADKTGKYSTKSGYWWLMNKRQTNEVQRCNSWRVLWSLRIPRRWKILMWKILQGCTNVKGNLQKWGIEINDICEVCGTVSETAEHLFRDCPIIKRV